MKYTYFDITDDTVFKVLRLQENPYIRSKYLKKIFPITIKNMPNIKKGDIIEIIKNNPLKITEQEGTKVEILPYAETHTVIVKKIKTCGEIDVQYWNWYNPSFVGEVKRFFKRLRNELYLVKRIYTYSEKENWDLNERCALINNLEKGLGIK